jgi:hypothetical protein
MSWFIGCSLARAEKVDSSWFFSFGNGGSIATESPWRLIANGAISVTSEDHGQNFGLPAPVDAGKHVLNTLQGHPVTTYSLNDSTGDLSLSFTADIVLQFLNMSSGYEAWRSKHGAEEVICMGGGKLTEFRR